MSAMTIGIFGLASLIVLLAVRIPVGLSLALVSFFGVLAIRDTNAAIGMVKSMPYDFVAHWSLSAIPLFLLMGNIAFNTGITEALFIVMRRLVRKLPGGLVIATNLAGAGFAAVSGSSMATAAALGRIAAPEMLKVGYQPALAAGAIAATGTLGALIPPSILMVLFAVFAQVSVGQMLIAGILPGLLTLAVYVGMVSLRCWFDPSIAPRAELDMPDAEYKAAARRVWPLPLISILVLGGIYGGYFTSTEAAAFGAFFTLLVTMVQRSLTLKGLWNSVVETLESTAAIFFIAVGAMFLTRFLALSGLPFHISGWIDDWGPDPLTLVLLACLVFLVLGMFLDAIGLMLLTLPVMLPIFRSYDMDIIWIGVLVVKLVEIGLMTPPVGLNVYVVKGVMGNTVTLGTLFRGVAWFLGAEIVIMALLIAFPSISTFLVTYMN